MKIWQAYYHDAEAGLELFWTSSEREARRWVAERRRTNGPEEGPAGVEAHEIKPTKAGITDWLNDHFTTDNG